MDARERPVERVGLLSTGLKRVTSKPEPPQRDRERTSNPRAAARKGRRAEHDEARKRGAWKSFEKLVTVAKKKIENIWVISHNIQNAKVSYEYCKKKRAFLWANSHAVFVGD